MRLVLLFSILGVVACSWDESWPMPVVTPDSMTAGEHSAALEACTEWNALLPVDAFQLTTKKPDGRFYIELSGTDGDIIGEPTIAGRHGNFHEGFKGRKHWAQIQFRRDLSPDLMRAMFAHELGHVLLGEDHSPDEQSIMFADYREGAHVTEGDAQAVIDAHGL